MLGSHTGVVLKTCSSCFPPFSGVHIHVPCALGGGKPLRVGGQELVDIYIYIVAICVFWRTQPSGVQDSLFFFIFVSFLFVL